MQRYQLKHHGRNFWLRGLVFLMVWGHFLLQRTRWMFTHESKTIGGLQRSPAERAGLPLVATSTGNGKGNRLLVLGVINEPIRDMIHFGTAMGWSIYVCNEVENAPQAVHVHSLHPEYFDKVPARDAPKFTGVLIVPPLLCRGSVGRMVEKFRVKRIAIMQFVISPDGVKLDNVTKSDEAKLNQEMLASDVIMDKMWDGKTRLFSLSSSKSAREDRAVGVQWDRTMQDCFSWLSR